MFSRETIEAIGLVARQTGIEAAALLAVAEVESGGRAFARIGQREEPPIRFEGHYFDRRLSPENRAAARRARLSSPEAGGVNNPKSQAGRWRLFERAAAIDRRAACESVSWGLGQVMGAHWAWLGYADVEALAAEARSGALGQARLMARYIEKAGLIPALRARNWVAFARGYNGPGYKRNGYHLKIGAAYARHLRAAGETPADAEMVLRAGARSDAVRDLQLSLTALGHPADADGIFGLATAAALRRFQTEHGLTADGVAGPQTCARLSEALARRRGVTLWSRLRSFLTGWLNRRREVLDRASRLW